MRLAQPDLVRCVAVPAAGQREAVHLGGVEQRLQVLGDERVDGDAAHLGEGDAAAV